MDREKLRFVYEELGRIREAMLRRRTEVGACKPHFNSCMNMQDFLTLKKFDLTMLQQALVACGLSSLERSHYYLFYTVERQLELLAALLGETPFLPGAEPAPAEVYAAMQRRSAFLKSNAERQNSVMVTLPSEAAEQPVLIEGLAAREIDIVRINTAHDALPQWRAMAETVRRINRSSRQNNPLQIYMDLAGPKIRTGRIRRVTAPLVIDPAETGMLLLAAEGQADATGCTPHHCRLVVERRWAKKRREGEKILLTHPELKNRKLLIRKIDEYGIWARFEKKLHFDESSRFEPRGNRKEQSRILELPQMPQEMRLFTDDLIWLRAGEVEGTLLPEGEMARAEIACSNPDVFAFVAPGDPLFIDDGKLGLTVAEKTSKGLLCRVVRAKPKGVLLKEEKGINFPETVLEIPAFTATDRMNLEAVAELADIIGISFVQEASEVAEVKSLLRTRGRELVGIVAKIETRKAVRQLPFILMELFSWQRSGVMLARGDLAIEVGFENLPRIQEEILELCEAAHMPVIYATQILESMMKKQLPSRAEVIDASMAQRADCIMLNKGAFAQETIDTLGKILTSVRPLFFKSRHLLPVVREWSGFYDTLCHLREEEAASPADAAEKLP